jgi:hypothetical protein
MIPIKIVVLFMVLDRPKDFLLLLKPLKTLCHNYLKTCSTSLTRPKLQGHLPLLKNMFSNDNPFQIMYTSPSDTFKDNEHLLENASRPAFSVEEANIKTRNSTSQLSYQNALRAAPAVTCMLHI